MPYTRLHYHLVWSTFGRHPLLDETRQRIVRASFAQTAARIHAVVHAIGLMPDHAHLAVSLPTDVTIAVAVRRFKGASSRAINDADPGPLGSVFAWQEEYGAFTESHSALPKVMDYLANQAAHHAAGTTYRAVEP